MAHQRVEISGSLTFVVIWPQAHNATCPRDCMDFIIVQEPRESLNSPCPRMRGDDRAPAAVSYVMQSRGIGMRNINNHPKMVHSFYHRAPELREAALPPARR
jgi:hypothetical protein